MPAWPQEPDPAPIASHSGPVDPDSHPGMMVVHADSLPGRPVAASEAGVDSGAEAAARASALSSAAQARQDVRRHRRDSICAARGRQVRRGLLRPVQGGDCPESRHWSDQASDSPGRSSPGGSASEATPLRMAGARIGLHASPSDLSPMVGISLGQPPFEVMADYWIRIGYFDATVEIEPHHRAHYKELRHGIVVGGRYDFGNRDLGIVPGVGLEWVGGDYAGLELDPEYELLPWAGVSLRLPQRIFLGVRVAAGEGVLGWFRLEFAKDFR